MPRMWNHVVSLHSPTSSNTIADAAYRAALTPTTTKALIGAGYKVNVERSPQRIFDDEEYKNAGAQLVEENTWCNAPEDHIIIGLKELPVETCESMGEQPCCGP